MSTKAGKDAARNAALAVQGPRCWPRRGGTRAGWGGGFRGCRDRAVPQRASSPRAGQGQQQWGARSQRRDRLRPQAWPPGASEFTAGSSRKAEGGRGSPRAGRARGCGPASKAQAFPLNRADRSGHVKVHPVPPVPGVERRAAGQRPQGPGRGVSPRAGAPAPGRRPAPPPSRLRGSPLGLSGTVGATQRSHLQQAVPGPGREAAGARQQRGRATPSLRRLGPRAASSPREVAPR